MSLSFRAWQVVVIAALAAVAVAGLSMLYANQVARQSEQKWCGIVATLDGVYTAEPPSTPAGRKMATEIAKLRHQFGCPKEDLAQ